MKTGVLFSVWVALSALLVATVVASFFLTGIPSLAAGLSIASIKAGLVFWYFMDLRGEKGLVRLSAVVAILWLFIFFLLVAPDYLFRTV
ncbi:cytochrome C oxidase subunit IV family protein [Rhizobium sp. L1K21]|uniref:cytochrome C oxidase subunit IV family protein n=1 Tax=Rhizobium sp. L1K21 TaxID=2954933 RepID=UPI0020923DEE|nr:cytochrome C oxidase subunit IV family protein [Rhizobium sp. L1K21]MCO6187777.1 cytochrome C oxidase subunit IV family protein [Rhizobium sp. L1K21]